MIYGDEPTSGVAGVQGGGFISDLGPAPNMTMGLVRSSIEYNDFEAYSYPMTETPPNPSTPTDAEVIAFPKTKASKADQRRFEARWGKLVAGRGYTMLPAVMIRAQHRLGLEPEHFNALLHLVYHWWEPDNNPYPAKATIAARMDKSPKTVQRYLKALEDSGLIRRIVRFEAHRGQTSNEYDLSGLVQKLAVIAADEAKVSEENKTRASSVERRSNRRGVS